MDKVPTYPPLSAAILDILKKWRQGIPIQPNTYTTTYGVQKAVEMQGILGWENFVLGRWSRTWQQVQWNYYNLIKSKRSPQRWTVAMIKKMIDVCWDMWDYRNELIHGKGGFYARAHN